MPSALALPSFSHATLGLYQHAHPCSLSQFLGHGTWPHGHGRSSIPAAIQTSNLAAGEHDVQLLSVFAKPERALAARAHRRFRVNCLLIHFCFILQIELVAAGAASIRPTSCCSPTAFLQQASMHASSHHANDSPTALKTLGCSSQRYGSLPAGQHHSLILALCAVPRTSHVVTVSKGRREGRAIVHLRGGMPFWRTWRRISRAPPHRDMIV